MRVRNPLFKEKLEDVEGGYRQSLMFSWRSFFPSSAMGSSVSSTAYVFSLLSGIRSWLLFIGLWLTIIYLIHQQLSMQQHAEDLIVHLRQEIDSIRKETNEALHKVVEQQQLLLSSSAVVATSPPSAMSIGDLPQQEVEHWPLLSSLPSSQPKISIILTAFAASHRNFRPLLNQVEAICTWTSREILQTIEVLIVFPKGTIDARRQELHQLLQATLSSPSCTEPSSPLSFTQSSLPTVRLASPSSSSAAFTLASLGWTYAQASNVGARFARGLQLVFLGERVIPASTTWISSLLKAKFESIQKEKQHQVKMGIATGRVLHSPSSSSSGSAMQTPETLEVLSAGIDFQFHNGAAFLPPTSSILDELRAFIKTTSQKKSSPITHIEGYDPQSVNVPVPFYRLRGVNSNNSRVTNHYGLNAKGDPSTMTASSQSIFLIEKSLYREVGGMDVRLDDEVVSRNPHHYLEAEDNLAVLDLCLRLGSKGYSISYVPDSIVFQKTIAPTNPSRSSLPSIGHWYTSLLQSSEELNGITSLAAARSRFLKRWYITLEERILSQRVLGTNNKWGIQGIMYDMYGGCTGWNIETVNIVTPLEHLVPMNLVANQKTFCHGFPSHITEALQRMYSKELSPEALHQGSKRKNQGIVDSKLRNSQEESDGEDMGDIELLEMYEDDLDIEQFFSSLNKLDSQQMSNRDVIDIWISHKPPDAYPSFPYEGLRTYRPRPKYVIGRSMAETTKIPSDWVAKCNGPWVDELWVPSSFLFETFSRSGVSKEKIFKIGEPLDVALYDPEATLPLPLPMPHYPQYRKLAPETQKRSEASSENDSTREKQPEGNQRAWSMEDLETLFEPQPSTPSQVSIPDEKVMKPEEVFKFLSVFKMERRKGWDILLEAYWREFALNETVALYLNTYLYADFQPRSVERIRTLLRGLARRLNLAQELDELAPVFVLTVELPISDMPRLYKAADAFVLPSRGEGWGMPMMEAMGMGLPVIATNWSGPTEFMNEKNSYPLEVEAMIPIDDPNWSHAERWGEWAQPSVTQLRRLMRHVFTSRAEAKEKGRRAREDIRTRFSHEAISKQILDRLTVIQTKLYGENPLLKNQQPQPQQQQSQQQQLQQQQPPQSPQPQNPHLPNPVLPNRGGVSTKPQVANQLRQKIHFKMNNHH